MSQIWGQCSDTWDGIIDLWNDTPPSPIIVVKMGGGLDYVQPHPIPSPYIVLTFKMREQGESPRSFDLKKPKRITRVPKTLKALTKNAKLELYKTLVEMKFNLRNTSV